MFHLEELLTPVHIPTFLYSQFVFTPAAIHISNSTSHADFGAATPGVGGSTHRRRATFDRCQVMGVVLRVVVCGGVIVVCRVVLFLSCVYVRPVSLLTA